MARSELMVGMNPIYRYPEKFQAQANDFFSAYILEREIGCPEKKMQLSIPNRERICRFCGLKYPFVTFRKDVHIFPEFFKNQYLISVFECDDCNYKFGQYEDHLSKFLGIDRTMLSAKGKEKIPKFKSPGDKLVMESVLENNQTIINATRSTVKDDTFEFDRENKITKIHFTKHPYVPLKVYKSLLKMAMCCISSSEVNSYKMAFDFLKNSKRDSDWTGMAHAYRYSLPYTFCFLNPSAFLFRKRNAQSPAYTNILYLSALNSIYQFIVPFHLKDLHFANKTQGLVQPWCPPIFSGDYPFASETIQQNELDLSSNDSCKDEKGIIAFSGSDDSYEVLRIIDKNTGLIQEEPFDDTKIKGINFLREKYNSR